MPSRPVRTVRLMPWGHVALAAVMLAAVGAVPLRAQPATVSGRVMDAGSGSSILGAEVRIVGADTVVLRTDARGAWQTRALAPGSYRLEVRAIGHVARASDLDLTSGAAVERIISLAVAPLPLDHIVVTAARRDQQLSAVTIATTLVTRAEIEQTGASDLASVLTEQTGIEAQGGHPAGAGLMIQGLGSERVLVLLDGQPLPGRISGVFDVSRVPTMVVERIEVVKGPQSTLYGSDAMGGVVNIITRTPPPRTLRTDLTVTAGTQNRYDGAATVALGRGPFSSSVDLSRRVTGTAPGWPDDVGALSARTDMGAKVRWAPDSAHSMEASVLGLDERQRWRSSAVYNFSDNIQWSGRLTATLGHGRQRFTPTVFVSSFDHLSRGSIATKPIAGDTGQRQIQRIAQVEGLYTLRLGATGAHVLDLGAQVRRDEIQTARVAGGSHALTSVEPFAQIELAPTATVTILSGVRVSHNTQWGTHVTPRAAARLSMGDHLTLRGSVGTGYRAPDFKELYMFFQNTSVGYEVHGNRDITPETSRNATASAEWAGDRAYLRAEGYWNAFEDFIETRTISAPLEPLVFEYANVDNGSTRGIELEGGATILGVRAEAGYSGLTTRDDATGEPLVGRPAHSGRLTLSTSLAGATRISVTGLYTGRTPMQRDDSTSAVTSWRDAYPRVDARIAHRLINRIDLNLGADNIFDRRPERWADFTGRHIHVSLSWTFTKEIR